MGEVELSRSRSETTGASMKPVSRFLTSTWPQNGPKLHPEGPQNHTKIISEGPSRPRLYNLKSLKPHNPKSWYLNYDIMIIVWLFNPQHKTVHNSNSKPFQKVLPHAFWRKFRRASFLSRPQNRSGGVGVLWWGAGEKRGHNLASRPSNWIS